MNYWYYFRLNPNFFDKFTMATDPTSPLSSIPPPLPTAPISIETSVCHLCKKSMNEGQECLIINECSHAFHRLCIEAHLATTSDCPICRRSCQLSELRKLIVQPKGTLTRSMGTKPRGAMARHYQTRSASRNLGQDPTDSNLVLDPNDEPASVSANTNPQNQANPQTTATDNNIDYQQINRMIEESVTRLLANMNFLPNPNSEVTQNVNRSANFDNSNNNLFDQPNINILNSPIRSNSNSYNSRLKADKISLIIQNWNVKFDGTSSGLNIGEFLYRIRTLTKDYFNNDFTIICRNLHILLTGKAREWYWRYHKQVEVVEWDEFCEAIRCQYRDFKSSFGIREEWRNRKQKPGESFDCFYEAVCTIMDRLPTPMSELELIEILARNLRPEIRQELLYVPVHSIPRLRKLVQMRENFLSEEHVRKNFASKNPNVNFPRRIADISTDDIEETFLESEQYETKITVNAIQNITFNGKCWNCDEIGHHWQDCTKDRSVFCYGCGEKQVYKPNCVKCTSRKQTVSKNLKAPYSKENN